MKKDIKETLPVPIKRLVTEYLEPIINLDAIEKAKLAD
jgi:hypothetical protein